MNHPDPEVLLRFAEGEVTAPDVATHVQACPECSQQLAVLGRVESHLALASELTADERARLRAATERVLAVPARGTLRFRRGAGVVLVSLAAVLVALLLLWRGADGLTEVSVRRYVPDEVMRSERLERFAIDVAFEAPRWLCVWQLGDVGKSARLMPHADPLLRWLGAEMPLAAGRHRVPAAEVLDFEFAADKPPAGLVMLAAPAEPSTAELAAIEAVIAATPRLELAAALQAKWPEARVVAFPAK